MTLWVETAELPFLCDYANQAAHRLGLPETESYHLQLAVDEACANVLRHAYGGRGGYIELTIRAVEDELQVTVRDWGKAFDPLGVPLPDISASLEERTLGGLGLYLMHQVMDSVSYQFDGAQGNTLTMTKRVNHENGRSRG